MSRRYLPCASALIVLVCASIASMARAGQDPFLDLHRLDLLPRFRTSERVGSVSSYDRTGGNDDGFSGRHSFVRKEPEGLVIAELEGPGVVHRIWTPTPSDDPVELLFDGEATPRIRVGFREMFLGRVEPFLKPLVGHGVGGFFSYVPIPFERSLKVRVRAERVQFYQINWSRYPAGAGIRTYDPKSSDWAAGLHRAREALRAAGSDLASRVAPPGAAVETVRASSSIAGGGSAVLFESRAPGRIVGLRLAPASALAGKARDLLLRVTMDGLPEPTILCPAGDFFGYAWGEPAMKSLLVGASSDVAYCYLPMPFDRSAKVELLSERASGDPVEVRSEVVFSPVPRGRDEGRLHAAWRRENPTTIGKPFTFLSTEGRGHLVGCVLQAQGFESGKTLFFEGDDQATIDGELAIHGTGSEDFFNGGWYDVPDRWEKRLSFPLSGCLGYQKHLGRTGGYRIFLGDALAYRKSLLLTMEHAGEGNSIPTDHAAVTWFYSEGPPGGGTPLPPAAGRRVLDLDRIVFPAWWQIPIRAFPFQNATLARGGEDLGGENVRFLSLRATGGDWFGSPFLFVTCELPAAGTWAVSADVVKGPAQGIVQLFRDEVPVGDPVDTWAEKREKATGLRLGVLDLEEGPNPILLKLPGKAESSSGTALDLIHLILEKVPATEKRP